MRKQSTNRPSRLKAHPSDNTRSSRRRMQKRRSQTARQQRWADANALIKVAAQTILSHDDDKYIRSEINALCRRLDQRVNAKQSDEQIVLNAIRSGCWTVEDIQEETGFTSAFIRELLSELLRFGKIASINNLYKSNSNNVPT